MHASGQKVEGFLLMVLQDCGAFVSRGDIDEEEDGLDSGLLQGLYTQKFPPEEVQDELQVEGYVSPHENHLYYPAAQIHIEELLQLTYEYGVFFFFLVFRLRCHPLYSTANSKQQFFQQFHSGINFLSCQELHCYLHTCQFLHYISTLEFADAYLINYPFHFDQQGVIPLALVQLKEEFLRDVGRERDQVVYDAAIASQDLEEL